ncbi:MAG: hypothetical protein LBC89_04040 [Bacteroidales bacterium]|jgi:hypothetical protein|nr:hypothetical protein [Bacteroidales bacterium]
MKAMNIRKLFRNLLKCMSVTTVMFIFQACYGMAKYGMPEDLYEDVLINGCVKSKNGNLPIKGIKVQIHESEYGDFTDENGNFSFYSPRHLQCPIYDTIIYGEDTIIAPDEHYSWDGNGFPVVFKDIDGVENGHFADSTVMVNVYRQHEVTINVLLNEKQ